MADAVPSNEYMRIYMLKRYHRRRAEAIETLGGKCLVCGSSENLEFDHIEPDQKEFTIAKLWSVSEARFQTELKKCQLLCRKHHKEKHRPKKHGTLSMYRYCRCDLCKSANTEWNREYRKKRGRTK